MKKTVWLSAENLDVHVHSHYSVCCEDITFEALREKGGKSGLLYGITDHSTHLYFPRDLAWSITREDFPSLWEKHRENGRKVIAEYISTARKNAPYVGVEADVFTDGTVVWEEDFYCLLDWTVGAVHFLSTINKKKSNNEIVSEFKFLTEALLAGGKINILAHPFRCLAFQHVPVDDRLIQWTVELCRTLNIAMEINSHHRFPDLDAKMIRYAMECATPLVFGSDAHKLEEFGNYDYHRKLLSDARP
ncbi:MAG: PHP domain-containing protein [Verrucomicrobiae bacterium]|nr:PHP domain-containing protein [Verrucomicrobiae bacterium]